MDGMPRWARRGGAMLQISEEGQICNMGAAAGHGGTPAARVSDRGRRVMMAGPNGGAPPTPCGGGASGAGKRSSLAVRLPATRTATRTSAGPATAARPARRASTAGSATAARSARRASTAGSATAARSARRASTAGSATAARPARRASTAGSASTAAAAAFSDRRAQLIGAWHEAFPVAHAFLEGDRRLRIADQLAQGEVMHRGVVPFVCH